MSEPCANYGDGGKSNRGNPEGDITRVSVDMPIAMYRRMQKVQWLGETKRARSACGLTGSAWKSYN